MRTIGWGSGVRLHLWRGRGIQDTFEPYWAAAQNLSCWDPCPGGVKCVGGIGRLHAGAGQVAAGEAHVPATQDGVSGREAGYLRKEHEERGCRNGQSLQLPNPAGPRLESRLHLTWHTKS